MSIARDILALIGVGLIVTGTWKIHPPSAMIAAGLAAVGCAFWWAWAVAASRHRRR